MLSQFSEFLFTESAQEVLSDVFPASQFYQIAIE
jgi:hypothetical protein